MALDQVYANIPQLLYDAQKALETAIEAFGEAGNLEAQTEVAYRKAKAEVIKRLRDEKVPVGLAVELAAGETADLKGASMSAEAQKRKSAFLVDGMRERIYTLRRLGQSVDKNMQHLGN